MVTIGRAHGDHFTLARRPHIHLSVDGRNDLRIARFDARLIGQCARVRLRVARFVNGARGNLRQQLMSLRLMKRRLGSRQIAPRRIHRGFAACRLVSASSLACALMIPCWASATVRLVSAC